MPDNDQLEKFKQTARDLECDESEEAFDRSLRRIVKVPRNDYKYGPDEQAEAS